MVNEPLVALPFFPDSMRLRENEGIVMEPVPI
jgi:hypothetical protein